MASNQNAEKGDDKAKEQNDTSVPLRSIAKRPSHLIDPNYDRINSIEVGKSIFYGTQLSPSGEKQDDMKSERSDTEEDREFEHTRIQSQFHVIFYLQFQILANRAP